MWIAGCFISVEAGGRSVSERYELSCWLPETGYFVMLTPKHITTESLLMLREIVDLQFGVFERNAKNPTQRAVHDLSATISSFKVTP